METSLDKLDGLLKDYLIQNTNYALMLTGGWGSGKSYYLKNRFFHQISDTKYQPVLVSLFGVRSVDAIKDRIIAELYPILRNKYLKTSKTILKTLVKSVDVTKLFGEGIFASFVDEISNAKEELKEQQKDYLELDKLLICFDDLERASPEMLTSSEILGFINSMVEDNNIKVIVVANEGILEEEKYLEIKEKTIGDTIHFSQNFNSAFLTMLELAEQPDYYKSYLKLNQQVIQQFLLIGKDYKPDKVNYRTLKHFIAKFSQIFQFLDQGLKIPDLEELKHELLSDALKLSLFILNECKKGFFTYKNRKGFDDPTSIMVKRYIYNKTENPSTKDSVLLKVADAYFPNEDFTFYNSLYDYLTGGDSFDQEKFLSELKNNYHVVDKNISETYKALHKLADVNHKSLSDQEYLSLTRKVRTGALNGQLDMQDYMSVFYYLLRYGNPLRISEDKLLEQLVIQIRRKVRTHSYHPLIDQHVSVSEKSEFYKSNIVLRQEIIEANNQSQVRARNKEVERIEHELDNDYQLLHDRMIKLSNTPLGVASFSGVRSHKFLRVFIAADNAKKSKMVLLFNILYELKKGNTSSGDLKFVQGLQVLIAKQIKDKHVKNLSGVLLSDLGKSVENSLAEIGRYQPD